MECKGVIPTKTAYLVLSGGAADVKGVPDVIKLLPLGHVKSSKGDFDVDEDSFNAMKQHFVDRGIDIVIDYEHQTLKDVQAPASGWIKDLFIRDGAVAAKVEWTPAAKKYIENGEYRYLSPVVLVRKSDGKAMQLHSAALTNTPAINGMYTIANSEELEIEGGDNMDILKKIAALLGLDPNASEDDVLQALGNALTASNAQAEANKKTPGEGVPPADEKVVANKVVCELLGLKAGAKTEDVTAAIMALKTAKPEGTVSEADFKALKDKLDRRDADDAVTKALKAGKLAAAQKDWATAYALKDPAGFAAFVEKAPQAVPVGTFDFEPNADKGGKTDDATLAVCKMLGVSEEDLKKYGKGE